MTKNNETKVPPPVPKHDYKPEARSFPQCDPDNIIKVIEDECCAQIAVRSGKGDDKLIILPEAWEELRMIISWGRRSPQNILEQKFVGMGHFLISKTGRITIVNHFIQIHTMNRTRTSASNLSDDLGKGPDAVDLLEYYRSEHLRYEREYNTDARGYPVDPFINKLCPSEQVVEGHTHPDLSVFLSSPDRATGKARAAINPVCSFVCDPIRQEMLAATGHELTDSEIIVFAAKPAGSAPEMTNETSFGELAASASTALRGKGCSGKVRCSSAHGGKVRLRIDLTAPEVV